jgi:hypothetical protein
LYARTALEMRMPPEEDELVPPTQPCPECRGNAWIPTVFQDGRLSWSCGEPLQCSQCRGSRRVPCDFGAEVGTETGILEPPDVHCLQCGGLKWFLTVHWDGRIKWACRGVIECDHCEGTGTVPCDRDFMSKK